MLAWGGLREYGVCVCCIFACALSRDALGVSVKGSAVLGPSLIFSLIYERRHRMFVTCVTCVRVSSACDKFSFQFAVFSLQHGDQLSGVS